MAPNNSNIRLDAAESVWFKRQLEFVDKNVYETVFPENKARSLIPTQPGIPDWAKVYTWRMFDRFGKAKIGANMADDIPRADRSGAEASKVIKPVVAAYGWDIFEIKASAATGVPLDAMKAMAARFAIETEIDSILASGNAAHGLEGLLNITSANTFTLGTKAAGGVTWAVATADELAADLFGITTKIVNDMKSAGGPMFSRFNIVLPIDKYALIATKRMGNAAETTVLQFVLKNSPWIENIEPWYHCTGAGAASTDRMVAYPKNPLVIAGIVPMEYSTQPPEQRNFEYVVNAMATCGGIVCRYPIAVAYADGL
jgi:hypothetical protein